MNALLRKYLEKKGALINRALDKALPPLSEKPRVIHKAMRYAVEAGGKRLRPVLVIAGSELCGGNADLVMPTACALEFIHTYSLIHDDLPAMDDDDLRRGKPTTHVVFGEDIAILAGDALLTHAFELMAANFKKNKHAENTVRVIRLVAQAAGTPGMVGGQVADIQADKGRWKKMSKQEFSTPQQLLRFIHLRKTGALIRASLVAGGMLAGGSKNQLAALDKYGEALGLLFQVTDDILDRIGDKKKLGKRGSDLDNEKLTFPALFGVQQSQRMARHLADRAHQALLPFGTRAPILHLLVDYVLYRDH